MRDGQGRTAGEEAGARHRRAHRALLAVCAVVVLLSAALQPLTQPLGWDELVYASRFTPFANGLDVPFEAPRTRGVPTLLAPVALWSDSVPLLRGWLSLLAGAALYAGFLPWLREFGTRPAVVPIAAAGYGTLWSVLFYASSAMPNHYTAMGATAAVGCFVRYAGGERRRRLLSGLALSLALATLMRPNDAVWIAGPLLLALLVHRPWRALAPAVAMAAGALAAAVPWVIESEVRFGGIGERLALATDQQGGMKPQFNVWRMVSAVDGPLLCRPCTDDALSVPPSLWWFALPVLAGVGLLLAGRARRGGLWLATAVAGSTAVTYAFLIDYSAARFLFTSYALLMIPAAVALHTAWTAAHRARLPLLALCGTQLALQLSLTHGNADIQAEARRDWTRVTAALREADIGPGCRLAGSSSVIPIAHAAGCRPTATNPDALVLRGTRPPHARRHWRVIAVPGAYNDWWIAVPAPPAGGQRCRDG
ncbi:hypothetical protein ACFQVC_30430 [Streptomyces monticola]|uniref:Glycosyltransferase RgtA/B/C/D-like domain-containing protein n=1 Tax=Streptomyces monticola TaxID=2666263 RepID=A0ABW2JSW8_9ACTN